MIIGIALQVIAPGYTTHPGRCPALLRRPVRRPRPSHSLRQGLSHQRPPGRSPASGLAPCCRRHCAERSLRLLPVLAGPRWIDQLEPREELALPSGLAQHVLGSQHKARIVRQGDLGHGG